MLIVDEPTRGVDVGAKAEVHQILVELAARGIAVMMISSELPEVLAVSDRIVTMREGRITGEMAAVAATEEKLMALMALDQQRQGRRSMTTTTEPAERRGLDLFRVLKRFGPLLFLLALMVVFAFTNRNFLNPINLFNVLRQISITGLIALGMTFVILTAGIDLASARCSPSAAWSPPSSQRAARPIRCRSPASRRGYGWFAALAAAIAVGMAAGGIQGIVITRLKVPPFVVTLGGLTIFRGLTLTIRAAARSRDSPPTCAGSAPASSARCRSR